MNDLLTRLGQLPSPEVSFELTERVMARAREISSRPGRFRSSRPSDRWVALAVAAMTALHLVWTVVFLNELAR